MLKVILPFICPRHWREALIQWVQLSNRQLNLMGLASMLLGTVVLYWLH